MTTMCNGKGGARLARCWLALALLGSVLALSACRPAVEEETPTRGTLIVASAGDAEQLVLGKIAVLALRGAGYRVVDKTGLGEPWVVRSALVAGNVDLAWDYTGTIWTTYLRHDRPIGNAEELFQRVREEDALNQIAWVANAPCQRALTLFMRETAAKELKIAAFKDLARMLNRVRPDLRLCVPEKQYQSASGISGLERFYGFRFDPRLVRFLPLEEGYQALERGECECALGYANDLAAKTKNLRALQDDLGYWQASSLAVGVRAGVLQESPELEPLLLTLSQRLTQQAVLDLHYQVAVEGKKPEAVAKAFLSQ